MAMTEQLGMNGAFKVEVRTTSGRGLTPDEVADMCIDKIISISDTAPKEIADQARVYRNDVRDVVAFYMRQAVASDRTTMYNKLKDAGHVELAEVIRKL